MKPGPAAKVPIETEGKNGECVEKQGIIDSGFLSVWFFPLLYSASRLFFSVDKENIAKTVAHRPPNLERAQQKNESVEDFCINIIINASKHKAQLCYRTNPLSK